MIYGLLAFVSLLILLLCIAVDIVQMVCGVPRWRN